MSSYHINLFNILLLKPALCQEVKPEIGCSFLHSCPHFLGPRRRKKDITLTMIKIGTCQQPAIHLKLYLWQSFQLKMLVEKPPKWLFRLNFFFRQKCPIFCIWPWIYLLNNALLFFSPICFPFSRKTKPKYASFYNIWVLKLGSSLLVSKTKGLPQTYLKSKNSVQQLKVSVTVLLICSWHKNLSTSWNI